MNIRGICLVLSFFYPAALLGAADDTASNEKAADDIIAVCTSALRSMDNNMVFDSRHCKARMTITNDEGKRVKNMEIWAKGFFDSLTLFTAPARDKGTKYLRINKHKRRLLYMYLPSAEKVIRISGHMLRQSMMGSDMSYEDALESPRLLDNYRIVSGRRIVEDGKDCLEMELRALRKSVTYQSRLLVVECGRNVPVRQELYARGGKLLKRMTFRKVLSFGTRWYPTVTEVRNLLLENSKTVFELLDPRFGVKLPRGIFSKMALERRD